MYTHDHQVNLTVTSGAQSRRVQFRWPPLPVACTTGLDHQEQAATGGWVVRQQLLGVFRWQRLQLLEYVDQRKLGIVLLRQR